MKTISYLSILLLSVSAFGAAKPDRYWEIHLAPEFGHARSVLYWRTHDVGENTQVSDACDKDATAVANATLKADGSWSLSGKYGNLKASLDDEGKLILTFEDKDFGRGQRIKPVVCENGIPTKTEMMKVAPKEHVFAAISGDGQHLEAASYSMLPSARNPMPSAPPQTNYHEDLPNREVLECTVTPQTEAAVRLVQNAPAIGSTANLIWPGALFQGKGYAQGQFQPITIPRAAGTISITGVNFGPGAKTSVDVPAMDAGSTKQAVTQLISQAVVSHEASLDFSTAVIFNDDQLTYLLGVDGRFWSGFSGQPFQSQPGSHNTNVLATFRQRYFNASIATPETKYSVFKDGTNLRDPNNEIGTGNPPLLVTSVDYGRALYLLATSSLFDDDAIVAAITSANDGKPDGLVLSRGKQYSYSQVLQGTNFALFAQGGDPNFAISFKIRLDTSASKFEAIKQALAETKRAAGTNLKDGVPIRYSMSYLSNRETAAMGFASVYYRHECTVSKKKLYSYTLNINCIDDRAKVTVHGPNGDQGIFEGDGSRSINLDNYIPDSFVDRDFEVELQLYNVAGPSCLKFQVNRTPSGSTGEISAAGRWFVGWIGRYKVVINRATGKLERTETWDYNL